MRLVTVLFCLILPIAACSTNPYKNFKDVKIGMDKTDVLDEVGSPRESYRHYGRDVWVYTFYLDKKMLIKQIEFESGRVVYAGDHKKRKKKVYKSAPIDPEPEAKKPKKKPKVWPPSKEDEYKEQGAQPVVPRFRRVK